MPALGMAQETGLIVAWHKVVGDAISEDDILLEVETDKSTVEVPAGHNGFVAELVSAAGQEVPVGAVIAVISLEKPLAGVKQVKNSEASGPKKDLGQTVTQIQSSYPAKPKATDVPILPATLRDGRILASPKARRLALKEGLDLKRLFAAGQQPPFHVADLAVLRAMPKASSSATPSVERQITARCSSMAVAEFITKIHGVGGIDLNANMIWTSFAADAWRAAQAAEGDLVIELIEMTKSLGRFENLDRQRMSQPTLYDGQRGTDLILRDLSKTAITSVILGVTLPTLTIGQESSQYFITFEWIAEHISDATALTFVSDFAARLDDPLRHLL
jgi:pyruvate/2-oxoglutarate dehydrogenase complex dihydrolipoamide acyltransferase (E2) component